MYLACEDVVLGHGCVGVFILVSVMKRSEVADFGSCTCIIKSCLRERFWDVIGLF